MWSLLQRQKYDRYHHGAGNHQWRTIRHTVGLQPTQVMMKDTPLLLTCNHP